MAERLTWGEIQKKYPRQWVGIVEPEFSNPVTIKSGIVKYTEQAMSSDEMALLTARGELFAEYTAQDGFGDIGALPL